VFISVCIREINGLPRRARTVDLAPNTHEDCDSVMDQALQPWVCELLQLLLLLLLHKPWPFRWVIRCFTPTPKIRRNR